MSREWGGRTWYNVNVAVSIYMMVHYTVKNMHVKLYVSSDYQQTLG